MSHRRHWILLNQEPWLIISKMGFFGIRAEIDLQREDEEKMDGKNKKRQQRESQEQKNLMEKTQQRAQKEREKE